MFDKLIVSLPEGSDFKDRRNYFVVSSVFVSILFVTALVISIYSADFGLGNGGFDLAEILPPDIVSAETEPPKPQPQTNTQSQSQLPTRQANIARIDEVPPAVPTTTFVVPNSHLSRPQGYFNFTPFDTNPVGGATTGRDAPGTTPSGGGLAQTEPVADTETNQIPPPVIRKDTKPQKTVSKGVLNGEAKSLPKPLYSAAAKAVRAQGQVAVQVTIDEHGNVISAHATNGHILLRPEAERAAKNARFSPTLLSDVPVKVTGIITYNFVL